MARLDSRVVMGATLFATPGMKGGGHSSPFVFALVVLVIAVGGLMFVRFGRQRPGPSDPDPGDGWGKRPRGPRPRDPERPRGGIPLEDAAPARVRLRGEARLADLLPRRPRRPAREPERAPERTPSV